jgi:Fe-S cluster assembly protein SufD
MSELATLPTSHDEDWRYADPAALSDLQPEQLDVWHEAELAPGETRAKDLILDDQYPGIHRVRLVVGEGSRAEIFAIASASSYTRLEVEVHLERGAHFEFGGVTIGGGDATREFVTKVVHAAPEATSNQVVRSVHWGKATGNFLGRIEIPKDSQKVDAAQNFKAILLELGASANAKPELEIFADDVKAAHGAAIGALDEAAAFYMASRGLPPETAKKLLVRAFIADAFAAMADEEQRDEMLARALRELDEEAL